MWVWCVICLPILIGASTLLGLYLDIGTGLVQSDARSCLTWLLFLFLKDLHAARLRTHISVTQIVSWGFLKHIKGCRGDFDSLYMMCSMPVWQLAYYGSEPQLDFCYQEGVVLNLADWIQVELARKAADSESLSASSFPVTWKSVAQDGSTFEGSESVCEGIHLTSILSFCWKGYWKCLWKGHS